MSKKTILSGKSTIILTALACLIALAAGIKAIAIYKTNKPNTTTIGKIEEKQDEIQKTLSWNPQEFWKSKPQEQKPNQTPEAPVIKTIPSLPTAENWYKPSEPEKPTAPNHAPIQLGIPIQEEWTQKTTAAKTTTIELHLTATRKPTEPTAFKLSGIPTTENWMPKTATPIKTTTVDLYLDLKHKTSGPTVFKLTGIPTTENWMPNPKTKPILAIPIPTEARKPNPKPTTKLTLNLDASRKTSGSATTPKLLGIPTTETWKPAKPADQKNTAKLNLNLEPAKKTAEQTAFKLPSIPTTENWALQPKGTQKQKTSPEKIGVGIGNAESWSKTNSVKKLSVKLTPTAETWSQPTPSPSPNLTFKAFPTVEKWSEAPPEQNPLENP